MTIQPSLSVFPVRTRIFHKDENLLDFIVEHLDPGLIRESMIVAVTSKIVSLAEMRIVEKLGVSKEQLIDSEADHNLGEIGYGCQLTIKHGLLIPSAGIDESNSEESEYILYPENPFQSARRLWEGLRERFKVKKLGVLLTDSHTTPLRKGVTGISLAHWGFLGLKEMVGAPDLFGRKMAMTKINIADALATAATLMMGEADECQPLAVIRYDGLEFVEKIDVNELKISIQDDLYYPLFSSRLKK